MALNCFDRALSLASDDCMADIWCVSVDLLPLTSFLSHLCASRRYNIGHIGVALGDLGLAYQAFKITVSIDSSHGEALNNIAVLEMRRQKVELARSCVNTSIEVGPHLFEPLYNSGLPTAPFFLYLTLILIIPPPHSSALFAYRAGEFQESYSLVTKALVIYPNHNDSKELKETLEKLFAMI
jgi:tetratricopeptide repeat protein 8